MNSSTDELDGNRNRVSDDVLAAVADAKGVSVIELGKPLYEVIDPDALDDLWNSGSRDSSESGPEVEFTYDGFRVIVTGDSVEIVNERR